MPTTWADTKRRVGLFLRALCLAVALGVVIGGAAGSMHSSRPFSLVLGALSGAITSMILTAVIGGIEIFLPQTRLGQALERAPFLITFSAKWVVYSGAIVIILGNRLGRRLAALILLGPDLAQAIGPRIESVPATLGIALSLLIAFCFNLVLQLSRLIGQRTLRDIVLGRYHRPRTEERFFLFVDIAGSTPLAERIGPNAVHRFLSEVFRLASGPIDDHDGEVYQYVGDEIVITWTVADGCSGSRPAACFFAIEGALARGASRFAREYGAVPRLRAALHAGPVIAGEVGGSRRAIVYHGDVMNTTSRLEQATRDLDRQFLVSGDALARLAKLDDFSLEDLGLQQLRGRIATMHVYAVTAKPSTNRQTTMTVESGPSNHGMQPPAFGRG
ncbi:MAG TPA: adenylate/guanylate cyclase domain-containing protein [Dehalococcoidia bacterium]|jgi:adenylate cyclase|nr:adenylate/guanylate cyclase domain-containing protein [Dehalococcoidia bacterium]